MNTIQLIKSKKSSFLYSIICWIFIIVGGNVYLNWILITNPKSKNPFIKKIWSFDKTKINITSRLEFAYFAGIGHFICMIIFGITSNFFSPANLLVNVYPVFVQCFIGYRCFKIKKIKESFYFKR